VRLPLSARATTFELLTGLHWRCRTVALAPDANEVMRMVCIVSVRGGKSGAAIPEGYYGNAFALPVALATAGELRTNPLDFAVELVQRAKRGVDVQYLRSVADLMVLRGWPNLTVAHAFLLSDVTTVGFSGLDFVWGEPAYGGPATGSGGPVPGMASFLIATNGDDGEHGVVVPMCLLGPAMDRFAEETTVMVHPPAANRSAL
jgi:benzyl alcohol O-benzoyltransferase